MTSAAASAREAPIRSPLSDSLAVDRRRPVGHQRFAQLLGDPRRHGGRVGPAHAGDPLPPPGHQPLLAALGEVDVVERELDLRRGELLQPQPDGQLVERGDLGEELAFHLEGEQLQVVADLLEDRRGLLLQEHLAAPALPAHVVHVVDVAHQIGLFEADRVADLVVVGHLQFPSVWSTANTIGSVRSLTVVDQVAIRAAPEASSAHPSASTWRTVSACVIEPVLRTHSSALQTRVLATLIGSPVSAASSRPRASSSSPSNPAQSSSVRSIAVSMSQATCSAPATTRVSCDVCDALTFTPSHSGFPSGRYRISIGLSSARPAASAGCALRSAMPSAGRPAGSGSRTTDRVPPSSRSQARST